MARTPLMAGNWKMNLNHLEAIALVQKLAFTLSDKDFDAKEVVVPVDVVVADEIAEDADTKVVAADAIPAGLKGLDIGPQTVELFASSLADAQTVFWNGPMGVFEVTPFAAGTRGVATAIAELTPALTVVGGGDSAAAVRALGIAEDKFSHISTGGGASLEYLEGKTLPGLDVLTEK